MGNVFKEAPDHKITQAYCLTMVINPKGPRHEHAARPGGDVSVHAPRRLERRQRRHRRRPRDRRSARRVGDADEGRLGDGAQVHRQRQASARVGDRLAEGGGSNDDDDDDDDDA